MQRVLLTQSICSRCRLELLKPNRLWLNINHVQQYTQQLRSGDVRYRSSVAARFSLPRRSEGQRRRNPRLLPPAQPPRYSAAKGRPKRLGPADVSAFIEKEVSRWSKFAGLHRRLESFGIPRAHVHPLLNQLVKAVHSGLLSTPEAYDKYSLSRFTHSSAANTEFAYVDILLTNIFHLWASDPAHQGFLEEITSPTTVSLIQQLAMAADRSYPAEEFTRARKMHRKVIMHVGPTNSGKTHHALRALAASRVGVYAGPLRLLAHEIWERLNLGQIVPLGIEDEQTSESLVDLDSALDIGEVSPAVQRRGNLKYARNCNLLTGEEQKIVDEGAPLMSCTVEMLSLSRQYDVAVVDEIQMIADGQRGSGWTNAVLGLCAQELHLCGEDTAVPLVEKLLKDTGDELIVKRYNRLTPLLVEKESLNGDLGRVQKGDCLVTFTRSNIFSLKRAIEKKTGMRCAVVYGRLPPEIRSEQAALFNDPDSGYDVIIGSDAIGMGLNLKINRTIFESLRKWDGSQERALTTSQIKQIAGRAGRYGLLSNETPAGFTTTLHQADLPFLQEALDTPLDNLEYARIGPSVQTFTNIANVLPATSTTQTVYQAHIYASKIQPSYRYSEFLHLPIMSEFIDIRGGRRMTMKDRLQYMLAPIPWRDPSCLKVVEKFLQMHCQRLHVDLTEVLEGTQFVTTMLRVEDMILSGKKPTSSSESLAVLETFHKIVVLYIWMSFRNPVSYSNHDEVAELKTRLEKVLDWSLEGMSKKRVTTGDNLHTSRESRDQERIVYSTPRQLNHDRNLRVGLGHL